MNLSRGKALDLAIEVVEKTNEVQRIEKLMTAPTGRPRVVTLSHVLIGLLYSLLIGKAPHLKVAYGELCELSLEQRKLIGFGSWRTNSPGPHRWTSPTYNTFAGCLADARRHLEVSRTFAHRHGRELTVDRAASNEQLVADLVDALVDNSIPERYGQDVNFAIDSTRCPAFARRPSRRRPDRVPADPDAYDMTKEDANGNKTHVFGFYMHAAVSYPARPHEPEGPTLIHSVWADERFGQAADSAVAMTERLIRRRDVQVLAVDREYSNAKPERFRWPLAKLGVHPVFQPRDEDLGSRGMDQTTGSAIIEGQAYCGAIPESLIDIGPPPADVNSPGYEEYAERFARRQQFAHEQHSAPKADGTGCRQKCPAEAGKVKCANKPSSRSASNDTPTVTEPLDASSPPCSQRTFTLDIGVLGKRAQSPPAGHPDWYDLYKPGRAASERAFSLLKNAWAALEDKGRWRLHGRTGRLLYTALLAVVCNLRQVHTWENRGGEQVTRRRRQARRTQRNYDELMQGAAAPGPKTKQVQSPP